eukprot:SAG11_NODE_27390_length_333_cov_0.863248_1_plen_58_part_01
MVRAALFARKSTSNRHNSRVSPWWHEMGPSASYGVQYGFDDDDVTAATISFSLVLSIF